MPLTALIYAALTVGTAAAAPAAGGGAPALQPEEPPQAALATAPAYKRPYLMEIGFRGRYLTVPNSVMDFWYFNTEDDDPAPLERPHIRGYTIGLEFAFRKNPGNWILYGEYGGNLLNEGYWDDIEDPPDHNDGDWVQPNGFGIVVFGANYAHEVTATPWLGFQFGGGLGVAIATGELTQWNAGSPDNNDPECGINSPAYDRRESCANDGVTRVPKVLPMVDITASARFNFSDHAHFRIDGGLHEMIYVGAAVGAVF